MTLRAVNDDEPTPRALERPIPGGFFVGLPFACGRIAGALELLLENPDSQLARGLAQQAFDSYREWHERAIGGER